ncbi:Uma2 family endonuclease [Nocardiopsis mwathae]|uniref:Uma2 family endonuclease n=1 Tax=Nocardiopsis mwathae TaxID=1472723 RepID=A0A7W9YEA1_9ACTN|nr:Uma2 family endonuclease [Nocardiopsis mwathae]MBB6170590.1 Uma2 family endonuclease [Nocardiopsis mwathae]
MLVELQEKPDTDEYTMREVAERLDVPEGFRVEILGGSIIVSPPPVPKHYVIANEIYDQLRPALTRDRRPSTNGPGVAPDVDQGDYAIPDLVVVPTARFYEDEGLVPAADVDFVMEVVSTGNPRKDILLLPEIYAEWGIPVYLLVDPRTGHITLFTEPEEGVYLRRKNFRFGDEVRLPKSLDSILLSTEEFPQYSRR